MSNYPTYPETLIPAKYASLVAELSAAEELFAMRLGVTMNCGDIRMVKADGNYIVQELRRTQNGAENWRLIAKHAEIASAIIEFRRRVVGGAP